MNDKRLEILNSLYDIVSKALLEKGGEIQPIDDLAIHYIELKKFDENKNPEKMEAIELWLDYK